MAIPRFILTPAALQENPVRVTGDDVAHARVLRLQPGSPVRVCDGAGHEWQGMLSAVTPKYLEVSNVTPLDHHPEATLQVTLYQGFARGDKLEWIVQKGTELGLVRLVPMVTAHSQVRLAEAGSHKITRWQEIARQATRQSGRVRVPDIASPVTFEQAVAEARQADVAVMPFEHADRAHGWKAQLAQVPQPVTVALLVGPEGGFSEAEVALARSSGILPVSLGPRILRSETAGLAVLAMALFQWGDLGGQA